MGIVELVDTEQGEDIRVLLVNQAAKLRPYITDVTRPGVLCRALFPQDHIDFWLSKYKEAMDSESGRRTPGMRTRGDVGRSGF